MLPQALFALAPDAVMLADLQSPAFLAPAPDALVGADARPQALLALVMLAFARHCSTRVNVLEKHCEFFEKNKASLVC